MEERYDNLQNPDKMNELFKLVGQEKNNYIKVIGVGGGGGNAVNHMMEEGIQGGDFILCNTDHQALMRSNVPTKVHLGARELGAGNDPNIGRMAAETSKDEIDKLLDEKTKMLFVTAGMGGGTGTGAAPVVAKLAKDKGILTVGIVTMPMEREGRRRKQQALSGIEELRKCVDTLITISTDKLRDQYGNMKLSEAFRKADDVLTTAAKGIAEIITVPGYVNVDFEDVTTVMKDSGKAIMGAGRAEGEGRAEKAIRAAISSPLLNDADVVGAKNILLYITSGTEEVSLDEVDEILEIAQDVCGNNSDIIWGNGTDESLGEALVVTLIATGFHQDGKRQAAQQGKPQVHESVKESGHRTIYGLDGNKINEDSKEAKSEAPIQDQESPTIEIPIASTAINDEGTSPASDEDAPHHIVHHLGEEEEIADSMTEQPTENPFHQPTVFPETAETINRMPEENTQPSVKKYDNPFLHENDDDSFEITSRTLSQEEKQNAEPEVITMEEVQPKVPDPKEELMKQRLRALSMNFKTQKGLEELENQPAYLRRNVEINIVDDDDDLSHYSSSKNGLQTKNSFLHDNVD